MERRSLRSLCMAYGAAVWPSGVNHSTTSSPHGSNDDGERRHLVGASGVSDAPGAVGRRARTCQAAPWVLQGGGGAFADHPRQGPEGLNQSAKGLSQNIRCTLARYAPLPWVEFC